MKYLIYIRFIAVILLTFCVGCNDEQNESTESTSTEINMQTMNDRVESNSSTNAIDSNMDSNSTNPTNPTSPTNPTTRDPDRIAPSIELNMRDKISWPSSQLILSGQIQDDHIIRRAELDGLEIFIHSDGTFELTIALMPGMNQMTIKAVDMAGNETTKDIEVYYGHRISIGNSQAVMIDGDIIRTWGRNELGQLGNGSLDPSGYGDQPETSLFPSVYERTLPGIVSVVTRQTFMVALRDDGTVWTWGDNERGQLGYETSADCGSSGDVPCQRIPAQVPNIYNAIGIAAGFNHTLVLLNNGVVLSFGDNSVGQLGHYTEQIISPLPKMVGGLENVVQVAAGSDVSYALTADGDLYAFGANNQGQLGIGTLDEDAHTIPRLVDIEKISHIAAANRTGLALTLDGTVKSWGQNNKGQVGVADFNDQVLVPTEVMTYEDDVLDEVALVFGDGFVSGAVTQGGQVFMWGLGSLGQLGQGVLDNGERDLEDRYVAHEVAIAEIDREYFDIVEKIDFRKN